MMKLTSYILQFFILTYFGGWSVEGFQRRGNFQVSCEPLKDGSLRKLVVTGERVNFGDFLTDGSFLSARGGSWGEDCTPENVNVIQVFASEKVVIDVNVNGEGRLSQFTVVSPLWEVDGGKRINLDGAEGSSAKREKAESGRAYGENGKHGEQGMDGGNGGNFLGIYYTTTNGQMLSISVNGGKGGNGQDGGDGEVGRPGRNADLSDFPSVIQFLRSRKSSSFGEELIPGRVYPGRVGNGELIDSGLTTIILDYSFASVIGYPGESGGVGGNGGNGGRGGLAGSVKLISVFSKGNNLGQIPPSMGIPGSNGIPGQGGRGAQAGENGSHLSRKLVYNGLFQVGLWSGFFPENSRERRPLAENGERGNSPSTLEPLNPPLPPAEIWRVIHSYRECLAGQGVDILKDKFLLEINSSPDLLPYWTPLSFANELLLVETSYKMDDLEVITFTQDFLARLHIYKEHCLQTRHGISSEGGVILSYVYASAVSKLGGVKEKTFTTQVINTEGFFSSLKMRLDSLKEEQRGVLISQQNGAYRENMEGKIREISVLINNVTLPSLDSVKEELEVKTEFLKEEIESFILAEKENVYEAKKEKLDFEKTLGVRYLASGLSLVGTVASILSPMNGGPALKEVLGVVGNAVSHFGLKDPKSLDLLDSYEKLSKNVPILGKALHHDKFRVLSRQLEETSDFISSRHGLFSDLSEDVSRASEAVNRFGSVISSSRIGGGVEVYLAEDELDQAVEKLRRKMRAKSRSSSKSRRRVRSSGNDTLVMRQGRRMRKRKKRLPEGNTMPPMGMPIMPVQMMPFTMPGMMTPMGTPVPLGMPQKTSTKMAEDLPSPSTTSEGISPDEDKKGGDKNRSEEDMGSEAIQVINPLYPQIVAVPVEYWKVIMEAFLSQRNFMDSAHAESSPASTATSPVVTGGGGGGTMKTPLEAVNDEKKEKTLISLEQGFKLAQAGYDIYNTIQSAGKDESELILKVEEAVEKLEMVERRRKLIYKEFIPLLQNLTDMATSQAATIPGLARAYLREKKWDFKISLKNVYRDISEVTKEFPVIDEEVKVCLDKIQETLILLVDLYDNIEEFKEKQELAELISNINSPSTLHLQIRDPEAKAVISRMSFIIKTNLFIEEYKMGMHSFKQWVFPYAHKYLQEETLVEEFGKDLASAGDTPLVVEKYKGKVELVRNQLMKYRSTVNPTDDTYILSDFTEGRATLPFFIWEGSKFNNTIRKFLSGFDVQLRADIDNPVSDEQKWSAVKYKNIELKIKSRDKSLQKELDERLAHFKISMRHSGASYYKLLGKTYVIMDKVHPLVYSFERSSSSRNLVHWKTANNGDFLKSPYTLWSFELTGVKRTSADFSILEEYADQVDLYLEGRGIYLDEEEAGRTGVLEDLQMERYYKSI